MNNNVIMVSLLAISFSGVVQAEGEDSLLDALSVEASHTHMKDVQPKKPDAVEPAIKAADATSADELSASVAKQLSGILGSGDVADEKETEEKLEGLVTSALLEGANMDDLRSAVSAAMLDISATEEGSEKVKQASKSLDKLIGKGSVSKSDIGDSYEEALKQEAKASSVSTASVSTNSARSKSEKKPSVVATAPTTFPDTVIVQDGESLYKIALRVYGSGDSYVRLYEANKDTISDPNLISIGQVIKIPKQ